MCPEILTSKYSKKMQIQPSSVQVIPGVSAKCELHQKLHSLLRVVLRGEKRASILKHKRHLFFFSVSGFFLLLFFKAILIFQIHGIVFKRVERKILMWKHIY